VHYIVKWFENNVFIARVAGKSKRGTSNYAVKDDSILVDTLEAEDVDSEEMFWNEEDSSWMVNRTTACLNLEALFAAIFR
jgi:hypothetical protein